MKRPLKNFRPIGPFSQRGDRRRPYFTVFFTVRTDDIIEGREVMELEQSISSRTDSNGGELFAEDITVGIETVGLSFMLEPGKERTYMVKVALTPTIQNQQDYFGLSNTMIDIIESEVNNMFGASNVKDGYEIVAGDHT